MEEVEKMDLDKKIVINWNNENARTLAIFDFKKNEWEYLSNKNLNDEKAIGYLRKEYGKNKDFLMFSPNGFDINGNLIQDFLPKDVIMPTDEELMLAYKITIHKKQVREPMVQYPDYVIVNKNEMDSIKDGKASIVYFKEKKEFGVCLNYDSLLAETKVRVSNIRIKDQDYSFKDNFRDLLKVQLSRFNDMFHKRYELYLDESCLNVYNEFDEREKKVYRSMSPKLKNIHQLDEIPEEIIHYNHNEQEKNSFVNQFKHKDCQSDRLVVYSDASLKNYRAKEMKVNYGILFRKPNSDEILLECKIRETNKDNLDFIEKNSTHAEVAGCLYALKLLNEKNYKQEVEICCDNIISIAFLSDRMKNKNEDFNKISKIILEKEQEKSEESWNKINEFADRFNFDEITKNLNIKFSWLKGHAKNIYNKRVDEIASRLLFPKNHEGNHYTIIDNLDVQTLENKQEDKIKRKKLRI